MGDNDHDKRGGIDAQFEGGSRWQMLEIEERNSNTRWKSITGASGKETSFMEGLESLKLSCSAESLWKDKASTVKTGESRLEEGSGGWYWNEHVCFKTSLDVILWCATG